MQIWAITTGEAGMRRQARGLAFAVAASVQGVVLEKVISLRKPWSFLPGAITPWPMAGLDPARDLIAPPWPDLLVACGRRSTAASIAVRRASRGRTVTVHLHHPRTSLSAFDLVVAMEHDRLEGPNVLSVPTTLHEITPAGLAAAALTWSDRFSGLPRPVTGVMLGGPTRKRPFTLAHAGSLADALIARLKRGGGSLLVTPSRRTPEDVRAHFAERAATEPGLWMWDGAGPNPYLGILAHADRLVVTSDSVSMISEALAAAGKVEVFDLKAGRRHEAFLDRLVERRLVQRFLADSAPDPRSENCNPTTSVAAAVLELIRRRMASRSPLAEFDPQQARHARESLKA
jgi:mitochondrial fission protein ELM1